MIRMPRSARRAALAALAVTLVALAAPLLAATAQAFDRAQYDPKRIVTPPIGRIPDVHPERFVLPNGAVVFLLENHDLPVVTGVAYFPSSPALVPNDRVGLAGLTGEVMRSGGTATHSGDALDDRLAAIGASIDAGLGGDLGNAGFRTLTENTDEVISLWADMLRHPAFPDDKIELAKVGLRRSIASRNDEMIGMLVRVAGIAVNGKDNPYVREPEYATIEPITAADCRKLHASVFVPERMVLAVYGDFDKAAMKTMLTARFGDWKPSGTPAPPAVETPKTVKSRLVFAPKEDVTQSGVVLAQPGSRADDPDYAAMDVLEQALGGGFSSRLFNRIRTQRGLAYATGANAGTDFHRPGVFLAYSLTKSESTMVALDLLREEVRKVTQAPFSQEELDVAKQAVVNGFVFKFEDPSQVLFRAAFYEINHYPLDFLTGYQKSLQAVDAAGVLAAAKRKITPDAQVAVIVGRESDFDRKLESAGLPVERADISIPPPPRKGGAVSATPQAKAKGAALMAAAAKAAGGSGAWAAVKTARVVTEAKLSIQGQSLDLTSDETWKFPNQTVAIQKLPFGEMRQGFDGKTGWMAGMGQIEENPKAAASVAEDYDRSLWRLFSSAGALSLIALEQPVTVDGTEYAAALVEGAKAQDFTLLFAKDGSLAGFEYQDDGSGPQMGPARVRELYTDWRAEGAIQYPHHVLVTRDGKPFLDGKITSVTLNPAVTDAQFAKPAK